MKIYLDFDGTVVEHQYPKIGRCNFGCMEVIKKLQDAGHEIILNTYRVECMDGSLEAALKHLNEKSWMLTKPTTPNRQDFSLMPITTYTPKKIHPPKWDWDLIRFWKEMYIDDIADGIPLKPAVMIHGNMVDWDKLDLEFQDNGIY
jgi:hypothetical protein